MPVLNAIQIETAVDPDAAVIWLHGLGADGHDFAPIVQQLNLPAALSIRFIFPHAPVRPITINQGYVMPGWYDITSLNIVGREDEAGIIESSQAVSTLCHEQEALGIMPNRIILAGFSQGGAIALHCGLHFPRRLGGIMALSTYLPQCSRLMTQETEANRSTPLFMAHGLNDDIVSPVYGQSSRQWLESAGYHIEWHEYSMAHSVCAEEIRDINHWLITCLK